MRSILPWVLCLVGSIAQAQTINQQTKGDCSPVVSHTGGNVTININCPGVDPQAQPQMNNELLKQNLDLKEKLQKAEKWRTQYLELKQVLTSNGESNSIARQARTFLQQGEFEEVGTSLNHLLEASRGTVQLAAFHHASGLLFSLQFQRLEAFSHFAEAYRLVPENPIYAIDYAFELLLLERYEEAKPIYLNALNKLRHMPPETEAAHLGEIAGSLSNLSTIYKGDGQFSEAELLLLESLEACRRLAQYSSAPCGVLPITLYNLGDLYYQTDRWGEAERTLQKALPHLKEGISTQRQPDVAYQTVAKALRMLGNIYFKTDRLSEAEAMYKESLRYFDQVKDIRRRQYDQLFIEDIHRSLEILRSLR